MDIESALKLVTENPITSSVIASVLGFLYPLAKAVRAALIRRVDQAWQEAPAELTADEKERHVSETVKKRTTPLLRGMVDGAVRERRSIPPRK